MPKAFAVAVVVVALGGVARAGEPDVETMSWAELRAQSLRELKAKEQAFNVIHPPDAGGRFEVDQDSGRIVFSDASGKPTVRARFEFVGTVSTQSGTWLWAWANRSMDARLVGKASAVRDYGKKRGFKRLTADRVAATADGAVELTAIALKLSGAQASYRAEITPTSVVYLLLTDVELVPR